MDEFDPRAELGLFPDKMFVCGAHGFLYRNNVVRDLCDRFIRRGGHLYDVLKRYDDLTSYVIGREEAISGSVVKWVVPFLKAYGVTDFMLHQAVKEGMQMMQDAPAAMKYISSELPTFITADCYEHGAMVLGDNLDAPLCECASSQLALDSSMLGRADSRRLRDMAEEIVKLKVPAQSYELNVPTTIHPDDIQILKAVDSVLQDKMPQTPGMGLMEAMVPMTSNKKAYRLLDVRRQNSIDLDQTVYVGSDDTDYQSMNLVRDAGGLSMAFNGADFAVRGSNVAVLSRSSLVAAVLAQQFNEKGIQAVTDMVSNWDRKSLRESDFSDKHLMEAFLATHPRKLPEVYLVDERNMDEVSARSEEYRKKVLLK